MIRVIIVGGKGVFSYEFVPKLSPGGSTFTLPFLQRTYDDSAGGDNLYPFLHLSSDGHLFVFANRDSILLDYRRNTVVKTFPRIPGDGPRNYPGSGSSVILPLDHKNGFQKVEVMICGGAASGAYQTASKGTFLRGLQSCGRMVITGNKHKWTMENMPGPRLLNDMILLPTGDILIINGARIGSAGWERARNASRQPYLYNPRKTLGRRFSVLHATRIPRVYHSSAILLPDGRILVGGGNPHEKYSFTKVAYPTELRLQTFTPYYMERQYHPWRPANVSIQYDGKNQTGVSYGETFTVKFFLERRLSNLVEFSAYAPPFTTHSVAMNQRMLRLNHKSLDRAKDGWVTAVVLAPPSPNVAPAGYYMFTVVNQGIPSLSQWVRFVTDA